MNKTHRRQTWMATCTAFALATFLGIAATLGAAENSVRIALLSDTHITRGTQEDQAFHQSRFARTIQAVNAAGVDLVLIAGDLTQDGAPDELSDFRNQIKHLSVPVWYVPGNHDVGGKQIPDKASANDITPARLQNYERELGPSWFVREQAGVRVVGVNSSLLGSGFPEEEVMWQALESALSQTSPAPTLMLIHYPLFSTQPDEAGGVYWNVEPGPRKRLLELARQGGVKAIFAGHLHRELVNHYEGMLLLNPPPIAFGIPGDRQYRGWSLITLSSDGKLAVENRYVLP